MPLIQAEKAPKSLARLSSYLFLVQIAAYALPLVTIPLLTRALGSDGYGRLIFATTVGSYVLLLVDFGFSLSATRAIAVNRQNRDARSRIYLATTLSKSGFLLIGVLLLLVINAIIGGIGPDPKLIFIALGNAISSILMPDWYYQGTERTHIFSVIALSSRLAALPLLFCYVHSPSDIWAALAINCWMPCVGGLVATGYLWLSREIRLVQISATDVWDHIRSGAPCFVSMAGVNLYTTVNMTTIGATLGPAALAYYAVAEKIVRICELCNMPITQAAYPRVAAEVAASKSRAKELIKRIASVQLCIALLLSSVVIIFPDLIVKLLFGQSFGPAVAIVRIVAFIPLIKALSGVFGTLVMLNYGLTKSYTSTIVGAGVLSVCLLPIMLRANGAEGAAMNWLIVETGIAICMILMVNKSNIPKLAPR